MLPPSDSFQHQELKLAEALSNIQSIEVPPPSYTVMPITNETWQAYTTEDDENDECSMSLAPITVHIDASFRIDGQANSIILPLANPNKPTPTAQSTNTLAGRASQTSHARAERLASTVLTALQNAGVVGGGDLGRRQRPLELYVNASVNVNGERNVICAGIPRAGSAKQDGNGTGVQVQSETGSGKGVVAVLAEGGSRKRRAESEPVETARAKRASL